MRIHDSARRGEVAAVLRELEVGVSVDALDPETGLTPLAAAASSRTGSREVVALLLARGADPNAECGVDRKKPLLLLAVKSWDLDRLATLLDAGADSAARDASGYDALISCLCARGARHDPRLRDTVELLLRSGAPLGGRSKYGESAVTVASRLGRFDVVRLLLDAGENPRRLRWTELHRAVALGSVEDVERLAGAGADLEARDCWDRSPWLLSMQVGDVAKARALAIAGADRSARGRGDKPALLFAVEAGRTGMVEWLRAEGVAVDETDDVGRTALMLAASEGHTSIVRALLAAGADPERRSSYRQSAMSLAACDDVVRALQEAGADPGDTSNQARRSLVKLEPRRIDEACTRADFDRERARRFGVSNPERMDLPFWRAMVMTRAGAWAARRAFARGEEAREAVGCYERYGQSITALPDGRFVEVGGEHEDWYDPDFCICNDVVVHDGRGG